MVKVQGAQLVDGVGAPLQLRGVNRSGGEFACSVTGASPNRGYSIWDGPRYDAPNVSQPPEMAVAMLSWGINAVRIPINANCWTNQPANSFNPAFAGAAYRQAVIDYIDQLGAAGIYVIVDLHAVSGGAYPNFEASILPMPDSVDGPAAWAGVAGALKDRTHVVYDLYNEPNFWELGGAPPYATQWACWAGGCMIDPNGPAPAYQTAGMQALVNAVRSTGSTQPLMLGGIGYASILGAQWPAHVPNDPAKSLIASFHNYPAPVGGCTDEACWNASIATIRDAGYPVVTGEVGQFECGHDYLKRYLTWADARNISYLAWTWNETNPPSSWTCAGPSVIRSYDGTPTESYGRAYRDHLLARLAQVDRTPPNTVKRAGPKKRTKKRKVKFKFASTEPGSRFECKLDRERYASCRSPVKRKVKPGKHKFLARAIDAAGNVDPTPARWKFKVKPRGGAR